jgi:L-ascorbate metabolism protein UlaG (beta-lactamase superfamily)
MGIDDAVKAVEFVQPHLAVPIHYNTFEVIEADPNEFADKVKILGKNARVMGYGEEIEV